MVNCSKCGAENQDDAKFCAKCGTTLRLSRGEQRYDDVCFGPRRREEDECFGVRNGAAIAGAVIGLFIVIAGLAFFFGKDVGQLIVPFILLVIGVLIIMGALMRLGRRSSSY